MPMRFGFSLPVQLSIFMPAANSLARSRRCEFYLGSLFTVPRKVPESEISNVLASRAS
jgi:hypothetical protein